MKKFLLTLGVACMALPSFASTRILYQQNLETAVDITEAGWSSPNCTMSIASAEFGKYAELSLGNQNGRTAQLMWGQEIFLDENGNPILEDGIYNINFWFNILKGSNNQYNGALTVFTNHAGVTNQPYRNPWSPAGYWQNYLFDMSQVDKQATQFVVNGGTTETTGEDGTISYGIDYSDPTTFTEGMWYQVNLDVNVNSREVSYSIVSAALEDAGSGTLVVPETNPDGSEISMYAEGLYAMLARYYTVYGIYNMTVSCETSYDYSNKPGVALTAVGVDADGEINPELRGYTVTFLEGETLYVSLPDGTEETVEWSDCEGTYSVYTTTSGTLKAWTKVGDATSEVVEIAVDCNPIALPTATATISAVQEGFGKTYTLSVSNADVPLRPTISIYYEFTGVNGERITSPEDGVYSGATVTVTEEGTLKLTTAAMGYQSTTYEVKNDLEFETKQVYDFARMTKEEIGASIPGGAWKVLNSANTSGFDNWTARPDGLLYYVAGSEHENEEGEMVYDSYKPFGFASEDNTTQVLNYYVLDRSEIAETTNGQYFEGLTIFPERGKVAEGGLPNIGMMEHVGLYNDQTTNNSNNVYVNDLDETDFVLFNVITNYGRGDASVKPVCANDEEYFAQLAGGTNVVIAANSVEPNEETKLYNVSYALNRVDAAITKIVVFKQKGVESGVEGVEAEVEGDNWYYSIDGVRMAEPTRPGIYIHNGKKIIVK